MYEFPNENFYSVTEFSSCKNFWDEQVAPFSYVNYEVPEQKLILHTKVNIFARAIVVFKWSLHWKLPL
jgi:hypothetical protein